MTVDSIFEKSDFLVIAKTGKIYKSVRSREVSAINLAEAIVAAKFNPEDVLEAFVFMEFGWLPVSPTIASLEASYAAS